MLTSAVELIDMFESFITNTFIASNRVPTLTIQLTLVSVRTASDVTLVDVIAGAPVIMCRESCVTLTSVCRH